jgi:hypothetical protein
MMVIINAKYIKNIDTENISSIKATIDGQEMSVPLSEDNRHYAEILKQVADGTITIAEAD